MQESKLSLSLMTGEKAEVAIILCPDLLWADSVEKLLVHKGEP
jgi:hypothetical protein